MTMDTFANVVAGLSLGMIGAYAVCVSLVPKLRRPYDMTMVTIFAFACLMILVTSQ